MQGSARHLLMECPNPWVLLYTSNQPKLNFHFPHQIWAIPLTHHPWDYVFKFDECVPNLSW